MCLFSKRRRLRLPQEQKYTESNHSAAPCPTRLPVARGAPCPYPYPSNKLSSLLAEPSSEELAKTKLQLEMDRFEIQVLNREYLNLNLQLLQERTRVTMLEEERRMNAIARLGVIAPLPHPLPPPPPPPPPQSLLDYLVPMSAEQEPINDEIIFHPSTRRFSGSSASSTSTDDSSSSETTTVLGSGESDGGSDTTMDGGEHKELHLLSESMVSESSTYSTCSNDSASLTLSAPTCIVRSGFSDGSDAPMGDVDDHSSAETDCHGEDFIIFEPNGLNAQNFVLKHAQVRELSEMDLSKTSPSFVPLSYVSPLSSPLPSQSPAAAQQQQHCLFGVFFTPTNRLNQPPAPQPGTPHSLQREGIASPPVAITGRLQACCKTMAPTLKVSSPLRQMHTVSSSPLAREFLVENKSSLSGVVGTSSPLKRQRELVEHGDHDTESAGSSRSTSPDVLRTTLLEDWFEFAPIESTVEDADVPDEERRTTKKRKIIDEALDFPSTSSLIPAYSPTFPSKPEESTISLSSSESSSQSIPSHVKSEPRTPSPVVLFSHPSSPNPDAPINRFLLPSPSLGAATPRSLLMLSDSDAEENFLISQQSHIESPAKPLSEDEHASEVAPDDLSTSSQRLSSQKSTINIQKPSCNALASPYEHHSPSNLGSRSIGEKCFALLWSTTKAIFQSVTPPRLSLPSSWRINRFAQLQSRQA